MSTLKTKYKSSAKGPKMEKRDWGETQQKDGGKPTQYRRVPPFSTLAQHAAVVKSRPGQKSPKRERDGEWVGLGGIGVLD